MESIHKQVQLNTQNNEQLKLDLKKNCSPCFTGGVGVCKLVVLVCTTATTHSSNVHTTRYYMYMLYRVDFQFLTVATLSSVNPIMQSNQYKTLVKEVIYAKLQYHVSWVGNYKI